MLECTADITTFVGRSMRRYLKGDLVWVTTSEDSQKRLGTVGIARKGKNAASAQYWTTADIAANFKPVERY
jgi:hypothetical protein